MHRLLARALVIGTGCLAAAAANAAPVVIDSEQKVNAALATGFRVLQEPAQTLWFTVDSARRIAEDGLAQVAAAATPASLMKKDQGITLPCSVSGSVNAQLARSFPRVLKLRWSACAYIDIDGNAHERNGAADIVLLSDSFTPERVGGIRLGAPGVDFSETRVILDPEQNSYETRTASLRITGLLPMVREFPKYGLFVGPFAFELTGFVRDHSRAELPDPQVPLYEQTSLHTYEFVLATGATTYSDSQTHLTENLFLPVGTFAHQVTSPGYPESTVRFSVDGLRMRSDSEFVNWTRQRRLDGRIDYTWGAVWGAGCLSGEYVFRTVTPLGGSMFSGSGSLESGDLLINGSTRAQFFSATTVPPTLPVPQNGMLAHVTTTGAGTFDYDVPGPFSFSLQSGCF